MKRVIHPQRLIPTNNINLTTREQLEYNIREGQAFDPIVVAPINPREFIILDGNHRAFVLAEHCKDIEAIVITGNSDRDLILALESEMVIQPFPHRDFLAGGKNFSQLVTSAKQSTRRTGFSSIMEMVINKPGRDPNTGGG